MKKSHWIALSFVLLSSAAWAQQMSDILLQEPGSLGEGWRGFTDLNFLLNAFLTLTLAAVLGAALAFHPKHVQTADTMEEIDAPKVFITYAVIGALIGIMVVKYGMVVGFVLFGIGGLIRFRTVLRSAGMTGHVILVTLIGLSCGLDLPHVAVLATVFGFVLIYVLNTRITYRIDIRSLPKERVAEAAAAYRAVLEQQGCRMMSEKKNPDRAKVTLIFRTAGDVTFQKLEERLEAEIDASLKGSLDWEID
ncbi:hypothetical protein ACFL1C_05305 [Pseudomonadota bacterium]